MLFDVSGVHTHPVVPFGVAFAVSFFTSMGGVSGAFLLLPFQVSILGYTAPSVSATNQVFNIVAIPSGVYRYVREGRMLWPLTWAVVIGTLPGVLIGAYVRLAWLPDPRHFKPFAGMVLLYIGMRLLIDILKPPDRGLKPATPLKQPPSWRIGPITRTSTRIDFEFDGGTYGFSSLGVYGLCFLVGIAGGIYGIGGGAIVAPFFVSIFGLPVYTVAGAALMGTFITSVAGVGCYHLLAPFYPGLSVAPDWILGVLLGLGGALGMYCGARTQRFVPARFIKAVLCAGVLFVAFRYVAVLWR